MKIRLLFAFVLCLISGSAARADIRWETSYPTALAKAKATGKPIFIDIYADWCGWCRKLDAEVYPNRRVQEMSRKFIMLKVDSEGAGANIAQDLEVRSLPTLIFATSTGQHLARQSFLGTSDLLRCMDLTLKYNTRFRRTAALKAKQAPKSSVVRRTAVASTSDDLITQPELQGVTTKDNYGGAILLDEDGVVALDAPAKKSQKASTKKAPAKAKSKRR